MAHIPHIQVESYNQYALCHIETVFFLFLQWISWIEITHKMLELNYSSLWKVLLLQYKHYTAVIKTNIIYFETEAKTSTVWITKKIAMVLTWKKNTTLQFITSNTWLLHIPHCSFKRRIIIVKNRVTHCFFEEGALVTACLQRCIGRAWDKRHDSINILRVYFIEELKIIFQLLVMSGLQDTRHSVKKTKHLRHPRSDPTSPEVCRVFPCKT